MIMYFKINLAYFQETGYIGGRVYQATFRILDKYLSCQKMETSCFKRHLKLMKRDACLGQFWLWFD